MVSYASEESKEALSKILVSTLRSLTARDGKVHKDVLTGSVGHSVVDVYNGPGIDVYKRDFDALRADMNWIISEIKKYGFKYDESEKVIYGNPVPTDKYDVSQTSKAADLSKVLVSEFGLSGMVGSRIKL